MFLWRDAVLVSLSEQLPLAAAQGMRSSWATAPPPPLATTVWSKLGGLPLKYSALLNLIKHFSPAMRSVEAWQEWDSLTPF